MAENHGALPPNGAYRAQGPVAPTGFGSRPVGQPQSMPQQVVPPRVGLPVETTRGPSVKISDVSRGLMTIDDMREDLAEYALFRFEKYPVQSRYDDEGRLQLPTWDKAIRSRVQSMSTGEIKRRIQHLNRKTRTPTDKLRSLSPALQRQIDEATEELTVKNPDPMNYRWVLVQLDHQLAEIDPHTFVAGGNHPQPLKHHSVPRRRAYRQTNRNKPRSFKRISLATYFKRVPKAEADIPSLYEAKRRMLFSQNNNITHPHPHPQPQPQPQSQPHHGSNPRISPIGPDLVEGRPPLGPNGNRPQPVPTRPNGPGPGTRRPAMNNTVAGSGEKPKAAGIKHNRLESDSGYSDCLSDRSFHSQMTPDTSYSSESLNRGRNRGRVHNKDRVPVRSLSRRQDANRLSRGLPEHHTYHSNHFDIGNGARMPPTLGPLPPQMTSPVDIDRATDDAYLAGVLRGRNDARMVQQRARREARYLRPNPRFISAARSPAPPYRRRISTSNRRGDIDEEILRLNLLSLNEDEEDYDTVLRQVDGRRRREFEYLMQEGSVLEDDPFDRERPSYPRYSGRRYEESYVTDDSDSEFSLPRRRRHFHY
ncbi:hypothetical protein F5Y00DRAFT_249996 [Daldinia vernicosa]|uniref:uncharacterized protein n=1 Tax=Daldinia vernicosa TaxID=114800 RepID=UPI002008AB8F|nr:uncharacterized protein F5Y00DRAFT_249996 [Daldinia vernicosa]KAI0843880.1 hypothetical protein F5Y00DRAFT_249996 [Daldinia vernicosa]